MGLMPFHPLQIAIRRAAFVDERCHAKEPVPVLCAVRIKLLLG